MRVVTLARRTLGSLLFDQRGQGVLEYGLILVLVVLGLLTVVAALGNPIMQALERVTDSPPRAWVPQ